ncbi:restriction endonuclease [Pseudomonas sp. PhalM4]
MNALRYPLFELSPQELEKLCLDLLNAEGGRFELVNLAAFDIEGHRTTGNGKEERIAVEVKHRTHFHISQLNEFIEKAKSLPAGFNSLIYITSAPLSLRQRDLIEITGKNTSAHRIQVVGQHELHSMLSKHPAIGEKYFKAAVVKKRSEPS